MKNNTCYHRNVRKTQLILLPVRCLKKLSVFFKFCTDEISVPVSDPGMKLKW